MNPAGENTLQGRLFFNILFVRREDQQATG